MTPSRHRRLVLAYDSNPSSDGSVLVSATPPARHHYCPPTPLRPRPHPQSRVESGHALSHSTTCHLSTSWRIRMNISRCVPGRERPRGRIVPTRTPARARRRSGANGASGASSSMSITSAASRHPRGAARPKQVSHGRCPASAAAGLREPQGVKRSSRFESYLTNGKWGELEVTLTGVQENRPKFSSALTRRQSWCPTPTAGRNSRVQPDLRPAENH